MQKCLIFVFSGTGNTKLCADLYKKYFLPLGIETEVFSVRMKDGKYVEYPNPENYDLIGFGFPVHGFNCPKAMNDFVKQLPKLSEKKPAFILKSSGEGLHLNDYAAQKIISKLHRRNYDVLSDRRYVMPYNMIFRHTDEMVKGEYIYANALIDLHCKQLSEGKREKVRVCPLRYWFVPIVRILWIYAKVQGPTMYADKAKCLKCNKCVKSCPLGNIRFDETKDKYVFGTNCVLCVSCSFGCPTKAISIGLLNGWRVNGSYNIEKTAANGDLEFPVFLKLKGFKGFLYKGYYRKANHILQENGVKLAKYAENIDNK
ncbi:MAG: EFR1 family ferrodoxin [Treponema sp.]|nr:EFR1 family ferrodoxin [Treponema sp.]